MFRGAYQDEGLNGYGNTELQNRNGDTALALANRRLGLYEAAYDVYSVGVVNV